MTPLRLFLGIAFAFSWACFGIVWLLGGLGNPIGMMIVAAAMLGPALGALACTFRFTPAGERAASLGLMVTSWKPIAVWLPVAWLLAIVLSAASVALCLAVMGQPAADPVAAFATLIEKSGKSIPIPAEDLWPLQLYVNLPIGILINTLALTFSEELGWRGWLQPHLKPRGFWKMSVLVGMIWGLWHAPIILMGFNYPGLGWGGVLAMVAFCVLLTPYLAALRETGAGVWAAGAMHGALNAVAGVSLLWMPSNDWPHMGLLGIEGFALMLAGWAGIWLFRRRALPATN